MKMKLRVEKMRAEYEGYILFALRFCGNKYYRCLSELALNNGEYLCGPPVLSIRSAMPTEVWY